MRNKMQSRKPSAPNARKASEQNDRRENDLVIQTEKLGRSLGVALPDDPTVATVVALVCGVTEIARRVADHRTKNPPHLSVLDAESEKEFLRNATLAYRKAHPPNRKRGRRSLENGAIARLMLLETELGRHPTRTEMIQRLRDEQWRLEAVSANTAEKWARLYLLWGRSKEGFSETEKRWLRKNFGKESLLPKWWMERWWQWWEELLRRTGVLDEIGQYFSMSGQSLRRVRRELEQRRLQLISASKSGR